MSNKILTPKLEPVYINDNIFDYIAPEPYTLRVLAQCNNDIGVWGGGFVLSVSKYYPEAELFYRQWFKAVKEQDRPALGAVQFVETRNKETVVANIIGQHGIRPDQRGVPPIRYDALERGLELCAFYCLRNNAVFHAPRLGAGLAGGSWAEIERMLQEQLCDKGVPVAIFDYSTKATLKGGN